MTFLYKPKFITDFFNERPSTNVHLHPTPESAPVFVKITLKGVQEALAEWKALVEANQEGDYKKLGLCSVIRNYYLNRGNDDMSDIDKRNSLPYVAFTNDMFDCTAVFLPNGIVEKATSMFPFGGGNVFQQEYFGQTMHENKMRQAWVNAALKA